jgi:hypothetical protein
VSPHRLETADVFRRRQTDFEVDHPLSPEQRKAFRDIAVCRTAALGGWVRRCPRCHHQEISYRSCRNRHCPKCQGKSRAEWLQARADDLLPVPYHHVVFTLPQPLGPIALQNQRTVYGILFRAVSETLHTIARDPRHLGARIGFLAVLHTWGQNLMHHPHLHCVVPAGGLSPHENRWIACHPGFLLSVRVLSRFFRGRFLRLLEDAHQHGKLAFHGRLQCLSDPAGWEDLLAGLWRTEWVVYSKPPFGGPEQALKYLARYTHRVAISNRRLISFEGGRVTFRWKDYRRGGRLRTLTLEAAEFIRRFLLHVLPKGFVRIRSFGFLANRCRKEKLALCRRLLASDHERQAPASIPSSGPVPSADQPSQLCPICRQTSLLPPEILLPVASETTEHRSRGP